MREADLQKHREELAYDIMRAGQLAAALEVSGWPKPGNVHRTADFAKTRFEHFIAGSVSLGPSLRDGALTGMAVECGEMDVAEANVGQLVKRAVSDMRAWQRGGNTHLGVILLFIPIAVASGMTLMHGDELSLARLRRGFRKTMIATTSRDASEVYEAITMAGTGSLGKVEDVGAPDLTNERAKEEIAAKKLSLYDVMKVASRWDSVASELVTALKITLGAGYPTLCETYLETRDINTATVHTYLKLLAQFPDTLIARNVGLKHTADISKAVEIGMDRAKEISEGAEQILRMGGLTTAEGRKSLSQFDADLRREGEELSPGTTADLTAASLMIALICGLRF